MDLEEVAGRAFDWVGSVAVAADGGLRWLEDGARFDDLYAGTAGVLLGCAEATAAGIGTGQIPAGARDRLRYLAGQGAAGQGAATMADDGVFSGWAGVAVALRAWSRAAGDEAAAEAAAQVTAQIAGRVLAAADGPAGCTDIISGDAGILLVLIADGSATAARAAHALADRLVAAAEPGPDGPHWRMTADWPYITASPVGRGGTATGTAQPSSCCPMASSVPAPRRAASSRSARSSACPAAASA